MSYHLLWVLPLALAVFVGFWYVVVRLVASSGWRLLAADYQVAAPPPGSWVNLGHARIAANRYNNALRASVSERGLALTAGALFRAGHAPLLIPWAAIGPFQAEKFLWTTSYTTFISTSAGPTVRFSFTGEDLMASARPWAQLLPG